MNRPSIESFKEKILEAIKPYLKSLRKGQVVYNYLYNKYPDILKDYDLSDVDCYYKDENIDSFINRCYDIIYMTNIIKKILPEEKPITGEQARLLTLTGNTHSLEKRIEEFIKKIDASIVNRAKLEKSYLLVEVPEDLITERNTIVSTFKDRSFKIKEFQPVDDKLFLIYWI